MKQYVLLIACFLCHMGIQAQINHTVAFDPDKLIIDNQLQEDGNTYANLSYEDCSANDSVGTPSLPYRILRFIVPNEPVSFSIDINASGSIPIDLSAPLLPIQAPIPTSLNSARSEFIPSSFVTSGAYPEKIAQLIDEGYLDGDKRILTVKVTPVQYVASSNQLLFHSSVGFTINYNYNNVSSRSVARRISPIASPPRESAELARMLDFVENKSDINTLVTSYPQLRAISTMNLPAYEYVVVTSEYLAPYFKRLIEWKRQKGLNAGIVTMQQILNDASIIKDEVSNLSDDAGKLRQYLKLAYNNGTKYVLLGGNDTVVPIRYGSGKNDNWDYLEPGNSKIPTDLYFSDLNGNWNVDGDKYLGEESGDKVDYYPELFVGRLLCKTGNEVENYIYKLLKYEQNPGNGDFGYLKKAFYTQADDMQQNDQARIIAKELIEIFPDSVIFQEKGGYDTTKLPTFPTGKNVIDEMNKKYGFYSWFNHGGVAAIVVASKGCLKDTYYVINSTEGCWQTASETGNTFMDLTNKAHPSIAYTIACVTMPFDKYPFRGSVNYQYNMGEAFTVGGKFGGPAYLGNTRDGWVYSSKILFDKFIDRIKIGEFKLGISEAKSKSLNTSMKHWLSLAHNLIGCPEFEIWTDIPSAFVNNLTTQSGTTLNINTNVDNTNIALKGLFSSNRITFQTGKVCTFTNVPKNYVLTFYKHNYLPYIAPIYLQNEQVNGEFYISGSKVFVGNHVDENKSTGDFVLKSGSKLTLDVKEIRLDAGTTIELGAELNINIK